ncbi:TolC family outer membrane protein [Enterovirga sp.]|uniref:TolC family outer membrane protein n=1 Tax=Enterovirga sp. TaxID=2026350 RepID=UPI00261F723F|nr:TolC family outer membrane protein [Enterovirga sp.]MDB5591666.1 channel protein TolC [Enterovirga sp.]
MRRSKRAAGGTARLRDLLALALCAAPLAASAETLSSALARAYMGNPTLDAQRASVRAVDENVPRALSGYRPSVTALGNVGFNRVEGTLQGQSVNRATLPASVGLQINQNLFNGFRTENSTRAAESQVFGSREGLRNVEQNILFTGAQAYMNVLRDTAILNLQRNNVEVLEEQLSQTRTRFEVGEVTRTDVAQSESRLAAARSQVSAAESNLQTSIATYRQIIGVEPRQLAQGVPVDRHVPRTVTAAVQIGLEEHPAIHSAMHAVDAAELQVKITEGELAPTVGLTGSLAQGYNQNVQNDSALSASVVAQVTIPIYQGGEVFARVRQAKETAGQRRIEAEAARDQVRAAVISAWGSLDAAKASVRAAQAQVQAANVALLGVREESRVGQRTTLDILNQQQELLNARVNLIVSQRDRVVASYAVVQAIGRLSARTLGLNVALYSAKLHFDQVKDLPWGLRTPDGR